MPLYEYRCNQCGHHFEKIQKFNAQPETVCPRCGGELHRPLSAPALQFKGAGWYVNDYAPKSASSGSSTAADKPSSDAAKPGGTDSKPAESKPGESKPAESKPASESPAKPTASGTTT